MLQGAIGSIFSLMGIIAPPLWTGLFGYFVSAEAPFILPGVPFFGGAIVFLAALIIAIVRLSHEAVEATKCEPVPAASLLAEGEPVPPEAV
jgi:hypothetical protein